jgi:two-component system OmpR family sensor kinase
MPRPSLLQRLRRRSLRTRLTGVLLALAAVGLVALSAITWGSQRRFLEQQVDDRAQSAVKFIAGQVIEKNRYAAVTQASGTDAGSGEDPFTGYDDDADGRVGGPPPGGKGRGDLPPGTYGQLRTTSGQQIGLAYAQRTLDGESLPAPKLPAKVAYGKPFTVAAVSGNTRYRVVAALSPFLYSGEQTVSIVAIPLNSNADQLRNLLIVDGVVILLILTALGFGAARLVGVELAPLEHIAEEADDIAGGKLDRRVPEAAPGTEVGRLGIALNAMLDRIEEAFAERQRSEDKLRQFLSDASHELRTPLASIRGYAELQRTGMLRSDEERAQAVARIEEQAARMGTLVEDLLALARLDEEREHKVELVDLAAIARDAVSDAGALDPEREVSFAAEGDALVLGDEARLRQVLTNLLGNAVVHTPAGTPIRVEVGIDDGAAASSAAPAGRGAAHDGAAAIAYLHVDDAGEGVPAAKRDQIFERFHREAGGTARTRGPAGAGLGLAVVRGIVEAQGGTVAVSDSPLGGARFTVRLPLVETGDDE